ncbi:bacteriocin immunity protein [Lactobacillus porci]|uniref:bacteriocin immunity protein n=1 Tax=Lactobacillus porci TaxID=2012477 RepID=UPI0039921F19
MLFHKKKLSKENESFKAQLDQVLADPAIDRVPALKNLLQMAAKRIGMNEPVAGVAANLAVNIRSNYPDSQLPQSVKDLQARLAKYEN